jgi:double-GTPase-like protein
VNPHRYMVFGFYRSGKSTFAAALWHLLDSRELNTALEKGKHSGDFMYLEEIAQSWSEGWEVERTKSDQVEDIAINLRHRQSTTELTLEFTDLPGERFETAFADRLCSPEFIKLVNDSSGMLLFVSADRNIDSVTILDALGSEVSDEEPAEEPPPATGTGAANTAPDEDPPWIPGKTPLQVQIVDLLQAMQLPPFEAKPLRVAVIVSAWDLTDEISADAWLAKRMPLLDQYLRSGQGAIDVRVYGVSAQGGRLSKKEDGPGPDRDQLLKVLPPSRRIKIVGPEIAEHDLTCPLLWLGGWTAKP